MEFRFRLSFSPFPCFLLAFGLGLASLLPPPARARARSTVVEGSPESGVGPPAAPQVAITLLRNKVIVPVRLDGTRELRLILDTGMGFDGLLLFNPALRDSLGSRSFVPAQIPGAGGGPPSEAWVADSLTFHVGEVSFENQRIILLAEDVFPGSQVDGVIGYSLLGHYSVGIDFDRLTLALHAPRTFAPEPGWASLPLTLGPNNLPYLELSLVVGEEPPVTLNAYIDCASSESVELLLRPGMKFTVPEDTTGVYLGRGLSGDIQGWRGRVARLILGPHVLRDVAAAFAPAEIRSKAGDADAVLADGALCRFNLVYDYAHRRLHLRPNRRFGEPFE